MRFRIRNAYIEWCYMSNTQNPIRFCTHKKKVPLWKSFSIFRFIFFHHRRCCCWCFRRHRRTFCYFYNFFSINISAIWHINPYVFPVSKQTPMWHITLTCVCACVCKCTFKSTYDIFYCCRHIQQIETLRCDEMNSGKCTKWIEWKV